jgi:hypothetical protein
MAAMDDPNQSPGRVGAVLIRRLSEVKIGMWGFNPSAGYLNVGIFATSRFSRFDASQAS